MNTRIIITGIPQLKAKLAKLDDAVAGDKLGKATLAGALVIEGSAKEKVHVITGNLKRNITTGLESSSATEATVRIGTNVEYAPYEEFGTRYRGPHPYLRPALDENKGKAQQVIGQALEQLLKAAV